MRSRRTWHIIAFDYLLFRTWNCVLGGGGLDLGLVMALYRHYSMNIQHSTFNQVFQLHLDFSMDSTNKQEVRMLDNLSCPDYCRY